MNDLVLKKILNVTQKLKKNVSLGVLHLKASRKLKCNHWFVGSVQTQIFEHQNTKIKSTLFEVNQATVLCSFFLPLYLNWVIYIYIYLPSYLKNWQYMLLLTSIMFFHMLIYQVKIILCCRIIKLFNVQ